MLLDFIIQQIVFPPDHGFWANQLVNDGNDRASEALGQLASGQFDPAQLKAMTDKLRKASTDLKEAHGLLKLDLQQAWVSPHLQRNRDRLPLFWCYHELFDSLVNFLETVDTFHDELAALDPEWRAAFLGGLSTLLDAHAKLARVADLRVERAALTEKPLRMDALRDIVDTLPAPGVFTSVYLGHLAGYGMLLCRLSDMHTEHLPATPTAQLPR